MLPQQRVCRLCEFPAADGGVPLDALDAEKLAEWWQQKLQTKFFISAGTARVVICQFCIWQARLEHENCCVDDTAAGVDWWTGHDNNNFFKEYFYKCEIIQPCRVELERVADSLPIDTSDEQAALNDHITRLQCRSCAAYFQHDVQLKTQHVRCFCKARGLQIHPPNSKPSKIQCNLCKMMVAKACLYSHTNTQHANFVRCQARNCKTFFYTEVEKQEHEANEHCRKGWKKCIFCGKLLGTIANFRMHVETKHKEAIRCDFHGRCVKFFHTLAEKEEHIRLVHKANKRNEWKCVYCQKICPTKAFVREHTQIAHSAIMIKCTFNRCGLFFLSQTESDEHYQKVHHHVIGLENLQCPKCGFVTTEKYLLQSHVKRNHKNGKVKCDECQGVFWSMMNLRRHLPCDFSKQVACDHCGQEMQKFEIYAHLNKQLCAMFAIWSCYASVSQSCITTLAQNNLIKSRKEWINSNF